MGREIKNRVMENLKGLIWASTNKWLFVIIGLDSAFN